MKLVASAMLAAVACVATMVDAGASPLPIVGVHASAPTAAVGDTVVVDVDITGVTDLYAFQFDLQFDPALLSFTGGASTEGAFLPGGGTTFFIAGTDYGSGAVTATADTLIGVVAGVSGSGILATFSFTAIAAGVSTLTLANVFLLDSDLNTIAFTTANASVSVQQGTALTEPSTLLLLALALALVAVVRRHRATVTTRRDAK
jgi:general secretion pathway protein D